ncbi:MAG: alpha/beta hydrolase [Pseudomonadota bacterium]
MAEIEVGGVRIAYERHGDADRPIIFLIQGLSMPLNAWPPAFIERLLEAGFGVVTMDNRDIGKSQLFRSAGVPNLVWQRFKASLGLPVRMPYTLDDMAGDVSGLIGALGIGQAHIVGVSMGGMIAQSLAIQHPQRCLSLTSIMSTTGNRRLPKPDAELIRQLLSRPASSDVDSRIEHSMKTWAMISSDGFGVDLNHVRQRLKDMYARGVTRGGVTRQMLAIGMAKSRVRKLREVKVPTLVIHGNKDRLVPVAGGVDTANAIPDAQLEIIEGMGHDLPPDLIDRITGLIIEHARRNDVTQAAA